ncbi:MAG: iron chelate uptake ABC transporter family permease subunit, partial [Methanosarcinaceae archaeon]|nr:iron chelate uptake ABC transporter family permease subunit [Methanosarcinaceae archaeon]
MAKLGRSVIFLLALILIAVIITNTAIGSTVISPLITAKILLANFLPMEHTWLDNYETIIIGVRLPRVLLAAFVGAALSTAGCAMQGLLKNPMADPYIIGMSSGAALGASIGFVLMLPVQLMSFMMAVLAIFVVYNISKVGGKVPVDTLLLSGIAIGSLLSAITSMIIFLAQSPHKIIFWIMGGLWNASWEELRITSVMIILGILVLYRYAWKL